MRKLNYRKLRIKVLLKFQLKTGIWASLRLVNLTADEALAVSNLLKSVKPGEKTVVELVGDGVRYWINYEDVTLAEMKVRTMKWYEFTR